MTKIKSQLQINKEIEKIKPGDFAYIIGVYKEGEALELEIKLGDDTQMKLMVTTDKGNYVINKQMKVLEEQIVALEEDV